MWRKMNVALFLLPSSASEMVFGSDVGGSGQGVSKVVRRFFCQPL
jgi:hypothetical protein